jgi:hypothetical protein
MAVPTPTGPAVDQLKALVAEPDAYVHGGSDLEVVQMESIQQLFERRRTEVPVLDRRATDLRITEIGKPADLVPLLFAHQTYKSYPDTFIMNNKWDLMTRWLDTLSSTTIGDVDLTGLADVDTWVARMSEHGHHVLLSSGTTGKASFLNRNMWDRQLTQDNVIANMRLTQHISPGRARPVFLLGPRRGTHVFVDVMRAIGEQFGQRNATYWLSELALTETDIKRQAELSREVRNGTATPGEIQEHGKRLLERQEHMRAAVEELADALIRHRGEPVMIVGLWLPHFLLMEEAHRRGMGDGALHPDSTIFIGGGLKGAKLPADFRERVERFHGLDPSRYHRAYGMVELSTQFLWCEAERYHCPPWVTLLILDKEGEQLLELDRNGDVEGRMAFFDSATEARWGGVISGDQVVVHNARCSCGRASPSISSIVRYSDLPGGDDKLSCAGTMSSYIRGGIET